MLALAHRRVAYPRAHIPSLGRSWTELYCTLTDFNLLDSEQEQVRIECTGPGFVLNNVHARGPVLAYQNLWMMWKAPDASSVEPKHLAFAELIKPAPDLIIFGSGLTRVMPPRATLEWLRDLGTSIEILPTEQAVQYFNLLNQEQRSVMAALLPEESDEPDSS
eukprot:jgi/Ulvmu1/11435/UM076_0009.1